MGFFKKVSRKKMLLVGVGVLIVSIFCIREINSRKFYAEYEQQIDERIKAGNEYKNQQENQQEYEEYYSDRCDDLKYIDKYMSEAESIIDNSNDVDSMMAMWRQAGEYCDELIYKDIDTYKVPSGLNSEHEQFIEGIGLIRDGIRTAYAEFDAFKAGNSNLNLCDEALTTGKSMIDEGVGYIGESLNSIKSKIN